MDAKNTSNTVPPTKEEAAKPSNLIMIGNDKGQIKSTNYWSSEMNARGIASPYCVPRYNWTGDKNETKTINPALRLRLRSGFIVAAKLVNCGGTL